MGYWLIVAVVVLISIGYETYEWGSSIDFNDVTIGFIRGFVIGVIISFFVAIAIHKSVESEEYIFKTSEVYALKDNVGSDGVFFLGSGATDSNLKYHYIVEEEKGKNVKSIAAGSAHIKENNKIIPKVEYYSYRFKNKTVEKLFPSLKGLWSGATVITIPEDSVDYDFRIDLE